MNKTELLSHLAPDAETRHTLSRVMDKGELTRSRDIPSFTAFLTDGEQLLAEKAIAAMGNLNHRFYGGYEDASRKICVFLPSWQEELERGSEDDPLAALEAPIPKDSGLTHRDFLGGMLGVGITREVTGDLLVSEDKCQVVCLRSALPILLSQWNEVGRYPIKPREISILDLEPTDSGGAVRHQTFQSLRFDAVAAAGLNIPRAKAAALIAGGKLLLNHLPCTKPDHILLEGDSISGKGYGKCRLKQVTGQSKKGRIMVELEKFS